MGVDSEVQSTMVFVSDVLNICNLPVYLSEFSSRNVEVDRHNQSGL